MTAAKSYWIAKHEVVRAYERVKANGGAPGADGVSLEEFEGGCEEQPASDLEPDELGELLRGAGAGNMTGCRTWTSKDSSTT